MKRKKSILNKVRPWILVLVLLLTTAFGWSQQIVTGNVTSDEGPLPGASVVVKGTTKGTTTDFDGNYSIEVGQDATLVFSYIGYSKKEVAVGNKKEVNVSLATDNQLDEVVVIGYGTQRKSDLTGSVSSVDTEDLARIPNARVDGILQGRSTGMQITKTSGAPGAATSIRIRGGNSIVGSNEPLWVIDGIIVGQNFDLNNINSSDIKSIEVLKDASSVAIYGSRGANGVILVTTKSGKRIGGGKPEVSIGVSTSIQSPPKEPAFMTGPQHVDYANEDARFRNTAEPFDDPSSLPNTDWSSLLIGPAPIYNVDASITGATENGNVNYYVSGNFYDQEGIIENSGIIKNIYRSNLEIQLSEKLKTGFRVNYSRLNRNNGTVSYSGVIGAIPERAVRDETGALTGIDPIGGGPAGNLVANAELNTNETITNNFLGSVYLEYRPSDKWVIRSTFNPEIDNVKTNIFNSSQLPNVLAVGDTGDASVRTSSGISWNNENTVQYTSDLGENHNLAVLGGVSFQRTSREITLAHAYGISSDATQFNNLALGSDPSRNEIGSGFDGSQLVSFFGRVNYSFKNRYLLTLVGRSDGSSRFAPGNKFAFFPSIAGAWRISEEPFMQNQKLFSQLKLRASYGKSGSQAIESYRTLAILDAANTSYNGVLRPGATLGRPANPNLKWETTDQLDIALEASLFGGRISTEIDYYRKETNDLLLNVRIPQQTGFISRLQNLGKIENKGLEFLLNTVNIANDNFNWSSTVTISGNRNKVLDLGGVDYIDIIRSNSQSGADGRLIVGEPAPVFTGVNYLGTWKNQADIDASGQTNQDVGGPRFEDTDGDGVVGQDDFHVLGSPQPDFIYGFQNSFTYKNFDFSFFIEGTQGNEVWNSRTLTAFFGRGEAQKYEEVVNRWTPDNQTSDVPRAGAVVALSEVPNNSEFVEDGSYLRLKSARIGYNLPLDDMHMNSLKSMVVFVTGSNLFLLSDFRLIDPETSAFGRDNLAQGFSSGQYPSPRTVSLGVNVKF